MPEIAQILINPEDMAVAMEVLEEAEKVEQDEKVSKRPDTSKDIILAVIVSLLVGIAFGYLLLPKLIGN